MATKGQLIFLDEKDLRLVLNALRSMPSTRAEDYTDLAEAIETNHCEPSKEALEKLLSEMNK
jgi:hypothetical protein